MALAQAMAGRDGRSSIQSESDRDGSGQLEYGSIQVEPGEVETCESEISESESSEADVPTIMVAGKPRKGKSQALNNIFGVKWKSRMTVNSVTLKVTKEIVTKRGQKLRVIDTPGLAAVDIDKNEVVEEMKRAVKGIDYTLIYCQSVSPSTALDLSDIHILKRLTSSLGKDVWKKCVILLTFSDTARNEKFPSDKDIKDYKEYLKDYLKHFYDLLKMCGADIPGVKLVFDYKDQKAREEQIMDEIVAVPVGLFPRDKSIVPGILEENEYWTDLAFIELLKKTPKERRESFFAFRYYAIGAGIAAGAAAGAAAGLLWGLFGAAVGAIIGAIGAGTGLTISEMAKAFKKHNSKSKK